MPSHAGTQRKRLLIVAASVSVLASFYGCTGGEGTLADYSNGLGDPSSTSANSNTPAGGFGGGTSTAPAPGWGPPPPADAGHRDTIDELDAQDDTEKVDTKVPADTKLDTNLEAGDDAAIDTGPLPDAG